MRAALGSQSLATAGAREAAGEKEWMEERRGGGGQEGMDREGEGRRRKDEWPGKKRMGEIVMRAE